MFAVDFDNEIVHNIFELISRGDLMDYVSELTSIAQVHGGIIETRTAVAHGISKAMLSKLCKGNKIHRVAQGQYILPDDLQDELFSITKRSDKIILSHETALFLHGVSDRTPLAMRLQFRPTTPYQPRSGASAKFTISSRSCLISVRLQ